jgi:hypothetical protein
MLPDRDCDDDGILVLLAQKTIKDLLGGFTNNVSRRFVALDEGSYEAAGLFLMSWAMRPWVRWWR